MADDPLANVDPDDPQGQLSDFYEASKTTASRLRDYLREQVGEAIDAVTSRLGRFGIDTEQIGTLEDRGDIHRYQYMHAYIFPRGDTSKSRQSYRARMEFKVIIYTTGRPDNDLRDYLDETIEPRLERLFNTAEYDGYMESPQKHLGFNFISEERNREIEEVASTEVPDTGLFIPRFEVEAYSPEGDLLGAANGYAQPYDSQEVEDEPPEAETWKVLGFNEARGDYEVGPTGRSGARERVRNTSKTVYINGFPVGTIGERGTTWLTKAYSRPSQATYTDRATITDQTSTPYQALSKGANLYKVSETDDEIMLSTTRPADFDPIDPDAVDPDAIGVREELILTEATPTQFVVERDENIGGILGLYDTPRIRNIEEGTQFSTYTGPGGGSPRRGRGGGA